MRANKWAYYNYIWKRKSACKYDMTPLGAEQSGQITEFTKNLNPLYPDIQTADVKGIKL